MTIIHSLWQGLLIAAVCWFILLFVQKENAQTRYMINISGVASILILAIITFISLYKPVVNEIGMAGGQLIESVKNEETLIHQTANIGSNFMSVTSALLPYITVIWMLGALIFLMKFVGGMFYTRQIRTIGLIPPDDIWTKKLADLSAKIKTNKVVKLYESTIIKVPTVIGHIKPIILFPVGAISGIPVKQVEAIIAHELAHIKRYDYLINLIQSIMEILFFYHPSVWWLNSKVNTERENCCDDMAMKVTGDRLIYAKALSNIEVASQGNLKLSPAFSGKKDKLLNRIQRLYDKSYEKVGSSRISTVAGIMLLVLFVILFSSGVQSTMGQDKAPSKMAVNNSIFSGNESISIDPLANMILPGKTNTDLFPVVFEQDNQDISKRKIHLTDIEVDGEKYDVYIILDDNDKVLELKINGEKIAKEDFGKYDKIVKASIKEFEMMQKEMQEKMDELKVTMEELKIDMSAQQEKIQVEMNEMLKELGENEFYNERIDEFQDEMKHMQENLHENLKHFRENELLHIEEDALHRIEELGLRDELKFGRDFSREFMKDFDLEMFMDANDFKKFNKEILEDFKNIDIDEFKFDEQDMKKLRGRLKDLDFDQDRLRRIGEKQLIHTEELLRRIGENQLIHTEELLRRIGEDELMHGRNMERLSRDMHENAQHSLDRVHEELSSQMEKAQKQLQRSSEMLERQFESGDLSKEELRKNLSNARGSFRRNSENSERALQKSMEQQNLMMGRRDREIRSQLEEIENYRINEIRGLEENSRRNLREQERQMVQRERLMRDEMDARSRDMKRIMSREEDNLERIISVIESELFDDEIIKKELRSFELTKKNLRVNGKKQSKKMYQKYLELYEDLSGKKLKNNFKIVLDE